VQFSSFSSYILLLVFCLRFLPSLEMHDHRTDKERCMQEHLEHRDQYTACELSDALGWEFSGHCADKSHVKEADKHCASCGFDFIKNFAEASSVVKSICTVHFADWLESYSQCYSGFTLLLCNKGPPALA
jgi:hypothetical protein